MCRPMAMPCATPAPPVLRTVYGPRRPGKVNGSHSRNRPCQDVRFTKNGLCIIDREARYKVYAHTNTSRLFTCHWWLTRAACHSLASANDEEAHLVARADRAAERRESRHRYRIDHGSGLFQQQRPQQQPGQGPGGPSGRFASKRIC